MDTEVIVVGAGPSGLALANVLIRQGVDVAVFDSKPGPTRESRAMECMPAHLSSTSSSALPTK